MCFPHAPNFIKIMMGSFMNCEYVASLALIYGLFYYHVLFVYVIIVKVLMNYMYM